MSDKSIAEGFLIAFKVLSVSEVMKDMYKTESTYEYKEEDIKGGWRDIFKFTFKDNSKIIIERERTRCQKFTRITAYDTLDEFLTDYKITK